MNLCVFFRETEPIGDIYISISPIPSVYIQIYYRYWLTWLQRPRGPTICCLQAGELESWWWNSVQVLRPENQGAGGVNPSVSKPKDQELQYLRGGKDGRPSSRRERTLSLPPLVCSIQDLRGLDEAAHTGRVVLLSYYPKCWSLPDTPTQTPPEIPVSQLSQHPSAPSRWHMKSDTPGDSRYMPVVSECFLWSLLSLLRWLQPGW